MIRLQAGAPVTRGDLLVIPVELVTIAGGNSRSGQWFVAAKQPVAVCLVFPDGPCAIGVDGEDLSLDWLCPRVPGLESALRLASASK